MHQNEPTMPLMSPTLGRFVAEHHQKLGHGSTREAAADCTRLRGQPRQCPQTVNRSVSGHHWAPRETIQVEGPLCSFPMDVVPPSSPSWAEGTVASDSQWAAG